VGAELSATVTPISLRHQSALVVAIRANMIGAVALAPAIGAPRST
jgi:hypothetical protein